MRALCLGHQWEAVGNGWTAYRERGGAKLNADWVVLSACNTIAGERPGAEASSGLARAFFYAGARAAGLALGADRN
jgi:CHAT domain-containing protein